MTLSFVKLKKIAFFCLALPACVFMLGFIRWYFAIPLTALIVLAYFFAFRDARHDTDRTIVIPKLYFFLLGGAVVAWCYFAGLGNLYYQSGDWSARNAIFRDLIRFDWPVVYESKNASLVYYIGYWLPAALFGKAALAITGDLTFSWYFGNAFLWLWSVICVMVVILMLMILVGATSKRRFWITFAIFVLFSGLDIFGSVFNRIFLDLPIPNHIEWWTKFQFSSITTCLNWVFNQAVPAWLAVVCFLGEKNPRNYVLIVILCAVSAPLPAVGLAMYMVGCGIYMLINSLKQKQGKQFALDVFTPQNIIFTVAIFPIFALYYITNLAVNVGQSAAPRQSPDILAIIVIAVLTAACVLTAALRKKKQRTYKEFVYLGIISSVLFVLSLVNENIRLNYLAFLLLEAGIYMALIFVDRKKDHMFYITVIVMMLCPLIHVGTDADFCMRASIIPVFVLISMCIKYLFDNKEHLLKKSTNRVKRVTTVLLVVALAIGSITPIKEFERGISAVIDHKKINLVNDPTWTFDRIFHGSAEGTDRNFIASNYDETFFFKYIAKK